MATDFDVVGVKNDILALEREELRKFFEEIVKIVKADNHLNMTDEEKARIVERMMREGVSLKPGELEPAILRIFNKIIEEGNLWDYVDTFVEKGEVEKTRFTEPVRRAMVKYLIDRGVIYSGASEEEIKNKIEEGDYDEHFFAAYDHALMTTNGQLDPLDNTHGKKVTDPDLWDFTVPNFEALEEKGIIPENIRAAGAIDYVYELGERMGIFRLVDALVLNWSSGVIDVVEGPAAAKLYTYWKRRNNRCTPDERAMLYKRVLSKGDGKVLDRMVQNEHFSTLWHNLMKEVADYIEKSERVKDGTSENSPVSCRSIYQATKELQQNLTEYCTGMAHMKVRELHAQLLDGMDILSDPEIIAHFGGNRRKSMWTVIEQISKSEFGYSPNIASHRTLAVDGNNVFQWIADFNEGTVTHDQFIEFLGTAESYILAAANVEKEPPMKMADMDNEFDDFEDEDEFEDF